MVVRRAFHLALLTVTLITTITTRSASAYQQFRLDLYGNSTFDFQAQLYQLDNATAYHHNVCDAYDEATIVRLISKLYTILVQLGAVESKDIVWPPPTGHQLDLSLLTNETAMDPRLISLLQKLPMLLGRVRVAPYMLAINYLDPLYLKIHRYIGRSHFLADDEEVEPSPAPPTALLLFEGDDDSYPRLVFDVAENSIRYFSDILNGDEEYYKDEDHLDPLGVYINSYANRTPKSAPVYLQRMIDKYLRAEWIACSRAVLETQNDRPYPGLDELRRVLVEDYGWPHHFRKEDWKRDADAHLAGVKIV